MTQTKAQLIDGKSAEIEFSGGSASTPAISFTGDPNTGIYSPGADQVSISTNGTGRLFIDSSGQVGIGTSSPYRTQTIRGTNETLQFDLNTTTNGTYSSICWNGAAVDLGSGNQSAEIRGYREGGTAFGALAFHTRGTTLNSVERLRINSSGNVGIGVTSPGQALHVVGKGRFQEAASSGAIAYIGGDATAAYIDTGTYTSNQPLAFRIEGTERARIDSSGRLLVGTSSAEAFSGIAANFQVQGTNTSTARQSIFYVANDENGPNLSFAKARTTAKAALSSNDALGTISFFGSDGVDNNQRGAEIGAYVDGAVSSNDLPGRLVFSTTADGASSPTERMRIDSTGKATFSGTVTMDRSGDAITFTPGWNGSGAVDLIHTTGGGDLRIRCGNTGGVDLPPGGTSWVTGSDERLKRNLSPIVDGLDKVAQLRAVTGQYLTDEQDVSRAFLIAQDVQQVLPEAVYGTADELGIAYTDVIPLLVAALKESKERIEALEAEVAALKAQ